MKRITSIRIFDKLADIQDGVEISLCYVNSLSLKKTKRSIDNDKFGEDLDNEEYKGKSWYGKMKSYQEAEKGKFPYKGVVRFSLYNLSWTREESYKAQYGDYKKKENELRSKYGIEAIKDREKKHDETTSMGVSVGATENTRNRSYFHLNTSNSSSKSMCFAVNDDDTLTDEMPYGALKQLITKKSEDSGVRQLQKMEAEQSKIDSYVAELKNIKSEFEPRKFELEKVIYMIVHADGKEWYWVNDRVANRLSDDLELSDTSDLMRVSKEVFTETRSLIGESADKSKARSIIESIVRETIEELY